MSGGIWGSLGVFWGPRRCFGVPLWGGGSLGGAEGGIGGGLRGGFGVKVILGQLSTERIWGGRGRFWGQILGFWGAVGRFWGEIWGFGGADRKLWGETWRFWIR